jgi:hypothetical protein
MWSFYIMAFIPLLAGIVLWIKSEEVCWWEFVLGTALAFAAAGAIHLLVLKIHLGDTETWSGRVSDAVYVPTWVEEYQVAVYRTETYTDSQGHMQTREIFSHFETRYRTHPEHWYVRANYGHGETEQQSIEKIKYDALVQLFGGTIRTVHGSRPGYDSGDRNDYYAVNTTGWLEPTITSRTFENRVAHSATVYSYAKVPKDIKVYDYPKHDYFRSHRLLGTAEKHINRLIFDQMNSRLGPTKKVNVIIVGFDSGSDSLMGQYQEAKWKGGKKNDLVITYGEGPDNKTRWVYVFGWTEKMIVKRNLESLFLSHSIDTDIIPLMEQEITTNYVIKDWKKFDYITVKPPAWGYLVLILFMALTQFAFWSMAQQNLSCKGNSFGTF